ALGDTGEPEEGVDPELLREGGRLGHVADLSPSGLLQRAVGDPDLSRIPGLDAGETADECALPGTVRAQQAGQADSEGRGHTDEGGPRPVALLESGDREQGGPVDLAGHIG